MEISGRWHKPIDLAVEDDGYSLELEHIPDEGGVYVFGRRWGDNVAPLYVGQSYNMRNRMKQHFDSRFFMRALKDSAAGQRFLICCTFQFRPGQQPHKVLDVVERGLIDRFTTEGHQLINVHGARLKTHSLSFAGNRTSEQLSGREMLVRRGTRSKKVRRRKN